MTIFLAAALLAALLLFEVRGRRAARLVAKTALSVLFVATAAAQVQHAGSPIYAWTVLTALILCLVGDVCLALPLTPAGRGADSARRSGAKGSPRRRWFLAGLVAFLLGHVGYVVAFFAIGRLNALTGWGSALTVVVSGTVFRWLAPKLGTMFVPVLVYVLVITTMVMGAWTVAGTSELSLLGRGLVIWGAVLFFVSDLFVARQRFAAPGRLNALVGLPLYYAGQFLIAFSPGQLP